MVGLQESRDAKNDSLQFYAFSSILIHENLRRSCLAEAFRDWLETIASKPILAA